MDYKEYMQGEPEDHHDLPSTFLSSEDIATETNIIIIPNLKIDLDLQIENYLALISKLKTKKELKSVLFQIWKHAETHGAIMERIGKLQEDIEMLQYDLGDLDFEIELVDDED